MRGAGRGVDILRGERQTGQVWRAEDVSGEPPAERVEGGEGVKQVSIMCWGWRIVVNGQERVQAPGRQPDDAVTTAGGTSHCWLPFADPPKI